MWFTGSYIELKLTKEQAHTASHQGQCDDDVDYVSRIPAVARQLAKIDPATLRAELKGYGAWDEEELADHDQNLQRLVWIAAGDIVEELAQ